MNNRIFAGSALSAALSAALIPGLSVASLALSMQAAAAPPAASSNETARSLPHMKITYLLFSGRPNPTLTLPRGKDFDMVTRRIDEAVRTGTRAAEPADPSVLGYNGILIEYPDAAGRLTRFVLKSNGLRNESTSAAQTMTRSVSAMQLEESLLALGRDRGVLNAGVLDAVRSSGR